MLQESEYQNLIQTTSRKKNPSTTHWIMNYKPASTRSKEEIDQQIANEQCAQPSEPGNQGATGSCR